MASLYGVMITMSPKRLAQIEGDPETLEDVLEARHDDEIPGLLDLGVTWDALDVILSDRGKDPVLGDAILGRSGRKLNGAKNTSAQSARVVDAKRVAEISAKLSALPKSHVKDKYKKLHGAETHAQIGYEPDDEEVEGLEILVKRVVETYKSAAEKQHQMLVLVVT